MIPCPQIVSNILLPYYCISHLLAVWPCLFLHTIIVDSPMVGPTGSSSGRTCFLCETSCRKTTASPTGSTWFVWKHFLVLPVVLWAWLNPPCGNVFRRCAHAALVYTRASSRVDWRSVRLGKFFSMQSLFLFKF